MDIAIDSWFGIGLGAAIFVSGIAVGLVAARIGGGAERRARWLQEELRNARAEQEAYRQSVAEHFQQTSDIFRDLTGVYTSLYTHLAAGARGLCAESVPALRFEVPARLGNRSEDTPREESDIALGRAGDAHDRQADEQRDAVPAADSVRTG